MLLNVAYFGEERCQQISWKTCGNKSPNVEYSVACGPSLLVQEDQHQEQDGVRGIGQIRWKFKVNFFSWGSSFSKLSTRHPGPGWEEPTPDTEAGNPRTRCRGSGGPSRSAHRLGERSCAAMARGVASSVEEEGGGEPNHSQSLGLYRL